MPLPLAIILLILEASAIASAHHGPPHEEDEFLSLPIRAEIVEPPRITERALTSLLLLPLSLGVAWLAASRFKKDTITASR